MESCRGEPLASSAGSIGTPGHVMFSQSPAWGRLKEKARAHERQVGALFTAGNRTHRRHD